MGFAIPEESQPLGEQKFPFPPPGQIEVESQRGLPDLSEQDTHLALYPHFWGLLVGLKTRGGTKWAVCHPTYFSKGKEEIGEHGGKVKRGNKILSHQW